MKLRSRLPTGTSEVEIVNKEDICHGSRNSSLAVGSADSDHHLACALLSLNGPCEKVLRNGPPLFSGDVGSPAVQTEEWIMKIAVLGVDLGKNVCSLVGLDDEPDAWRTGTQCLERSL